MVLGIAVVLAACGSDEQPPAGDRYSAALAPNLFVGDGNGVDDEARECVSAEFVAALGGPEALESAGVTPEEFGDADDLAALGITVERAQAAQVADALEPCGVSVVELLLSELDLPPETRTCVESNLDRTALRSFIVQTIVDESTDVGDAGAVVEPLLVCFPS